MQFYKFWKCGLIVGWADMFRWKKLRISICSNQQHQIAWKSTHLACLTYNHPQKSFNLVQNWKLGQKLYLSTFGCKSLVKSCQLGDKFWTFPWNSPCECGAAWKVFDSMIRRKKSTQKVEKSNKGTNKRKKSYNDVFCWMDEKGPFVFGTRTYRKWN